jgi:hypothetical protein
MATSYSIAIQTFVYRCEAHFKPLLAELDRQAPTVAKVVFVNGQHGEPFDQAYRSDILGYVARFPNVYPIMSPIVRGCAFMWNTCCNFTDTPVILNLNDDVTVHDGFIPEYETLLAHLPDETFTLGGFSSASIRRQDLFDVGYFDERLLGFGEEDGDWVWRWIAKRGRDIRQVHTAKLTNHSHPAPTDSKNMRKHLDKYSAFNREWLFANKYELAPQTGVNAGPLHAGMFDAPARLRPGGETPHYYPAERWYRDNIHRL